MTVSVHAGPICVVGGDSSYAMPERGCQRGMRASMLSRPIMPYAFASDYFLIVFFDSASMVTSTCAPGLSSTSAPSLSVRALSMRISL
jgi:hypothetical protein